jgi:NAD(P)-dependent dehydrogenase (short-subunit alcohol dehydrogenase family)
LVDQRSPATRILYNRWMKNLNGKVALVTGGSSGLGRGTALRLAGMGVKVALAARSHQRLDQCAADIRAQGGTALVLPTDVSVAEECRRAVDETVNTFGRLDILLCSAGLSMRSYFEGSDLEAMERVMRVNFFGTLYATHFALPPVKKTGGSLVAISSLTGKRGIPSYALYGASKFAIQGLYEALQVELSQDGVHVGIVSPAFVDTPLRENVLGFDGKPWPVPPPPPFRIWPMAKCVDRIVRLITHRQSEVMLPWFAGPLVSIDQLLGRRLGDRLLRWRFSPEKR